MYSLNRVNSSMYIIMQDGVEIGETKFDGFSWKVKVNIFIDDVVRCNIMAMVQKLPVMPISSIVGNHLVSHVVTDMLIGSQVISMYIPDIVEVIRADTGLAAVRYNGTLYMVDDEYEVISGLVNDYRLEETL